MATSKRSIDQTSAETGSFPGMSADTSTAAAGRIADVAERASGAVSAAAARVREQTGEAIDQVRQAGRSAVRSAQERVQSHPLPSVGLAFAAGVAVGVVLDRLLSHD